MDGLSVIKTEKQHAVLEMQVLTSALTHHPDDKARSQGSGYCPMVMLLASVLSVLLLFSHLLLGSLVATLVLLIVVITLHIKAFLLAKKLTDVTSK